MGSAYIQYCMNVCQSQKRLVSIGLKKCSKSTIAVIRITSMTSWQVMNRGFTRMSPKLNSSQLYRCFKMSQIQRNLLEHESLPSKLSPVFFFFWKTGHVAIVPLEQRRTVNSKWHTTICLPVVFQEIKKTNRRKRITLHHDKVSSHTLAQTTAFLSTQTSIWWVICRIVLIWQRMAAFYSRTQKIRWEVNVFRHLKKRLMRLNWFKRIQKCIDLNGEYVEKQ